MNDEALTELRAIRERLDALPMAIVEAVLTHLIDRVESSSAPDGCGHPIEQRADLGDGEWACTARGCGYRHLVTAQGNR